LKLEPKEADKLPLPAPETLRRIAPQLRALRPQLGRPLRSADLLDVVRQIDRLLLTQHFRLRREQIHHLRTAREALFTRRLTRAGKKR